MAVVIRRAWAEVEEAALGTARTARETPDGRLEKTVIKRVP